MAAVIGPRPSVEEQLQAQSSVPASSSSAMQSSAKPSHGFETNQQTAPSKNSFTDVETLRRRARQSIEQGAVTPSSYNADRETVVRLLNEALATELVCVLRYKRHYFTAKGMASQSVADEFLEHAKEEEEHADRIAERIVQLGAEPNFSPVGLAERSHAEYVEGNTLADMVKEDLVAERIAIESYREFVQYLGDSDPTSRRMLEEILAVEEEHAEDLLSLLERS